MGSLRTLAEARHPSLLPVGCDARRRMLASEDQAAAKGSSSSTPASGPGYTSGYTEGVKRGEYQTRVDQMHSSGGDVVGYATTNYRDSRGSNTVQGEHPFTVDIATSVLTTSEADGRSGFRPIQVCPRTSGSTFPVGLEVSTNYFGWRYRRRQGNLLLRRRTRLTASG